MDAYFEGATTCDARIMYCVFAGFLLPLGIIFKSGANCIKNPRFFPNSDESGECAPRTTLATVYVLILLLLFGIPILFAGVLWLIPGFIVGVIWSFIACYRS